MVCSAGHGAKAVRHRGTEIGERVRAGIPQHGQALRAERLSKAQQAVAVGEDEKFFWTIKAGIGQGRKRLDGVARSHLQGGAVDGNGLLRYRADPKCSAVRGKVGAAGAGDADLSDTSLVDG